MTAHRQRFASRLLAAAVLASTWLGGACGSGEPSAGGDRTGARPSILLITMDTTRADAIGPEAAGVATPGFNAIAARGRRFRQAYATAPETLPSHTSMLTGLYPGGHAVHENGRRLRDQQAVLADDLQRAGYHTVAVVSSAVLARRYGLARGFAVYLDDQPAGRAERSARETTDLAIGALPAPGGGAPVFLWVHYFDPHAPYTPPEPFAAQYAAAPYRGEVAAMDQQIGRLTAAFEARAAGPAAIVIAADHGEGLGDHGESQHGNLLYQSTMHVPLAIAGPGVSAGVVDTPVSTRRVFHTIRDWAGLDARDSLRGSSSEIVLGEAMRPFLNYGWQPQIMAVEGRHKWVLAGRVETYDVVGDPAEARDLVTTTPLPPAVPNALREYPVPAPNAPRAGDAQTDESRRQLASLGYVSAGTTPVVRKDAPRPADMVRIFDLLDLASGLFVAEQYAAVIPLLDQILKVDPYNLDATLRLATAHSTLGHDAQALEMFRKAASLAPGSRDVSLYLALHYARGREWARAAPMLEAIVAESPDRLPALEALAAVREKQARLDDALELRRRIYSLRTPSAVELIRLGQLAMGRRQTAIAIEAFEQARALQGPAFRNDLDLGVLYLADRQLQPAVAALDRVPASHPDYAMALFKRAQVSVLLNEPDRAQRIEAARRRADATTRGLIANERLFQNVK